MGLIQKTRVFITHGYTANSQKHWFNWLKARLENHGFLVNVLDMPNSSKPTPDEWLAHHQNEIPEIQSTDIFIGHSLGCIATLRFLARELPRQNQQLNGLILVAGFDQSLPNLRELDSFTAEKLDYAELNKRISQCSLLASLDDDVVFHEFTEKLALNLRAKYCVTDGYGHFVERQGVTELPWVLDEVLNMRSGA